MYGLLFTFVPPFFIVPFLRCPLPDLDQWNVISTTREGSARPTPGGRRGSRRSFGDAQTVAFEGSTSDPDTGAGCTLAWHSGFENGFPGEWPPSFQTATSIPTRQVGLQPSPGELLLSSCTSIRDSATRLDFRGPRGFRDSATQRRWRGVATIPTITPN